MMARSGAPRPVTPLAILAATLEQLRGRMAAVGGADEVSRGLLREACELAGGLDDYLERCTTPESASLRALACATQAADWPGSDSAVPLEQEMLSGHVEGQLLATLVHATRARRVLEIGMFTGYSALAMAEALPDDGRVIACEIDPGAAALARKHFHDSVHGHKIEILLGAAAGSLRGLAGLGAVFDLVFIDADKAGYREYVDTVLDSGLLAAHGLIAVDNTMMQGQPWRSGDRSENGTAIADFNTGLAADPRVAQVLIPLRDGLTLIRQKETACSTPS